MRVDYGEGAAEAVVSVETLMVYEQEFGGDLIRDFLGLQDMAEDEGPSDSVDFRQVNWTALVRVLWAALKVADPGMPRFAEWAAGLGDVDLLAVNAQLGPEVVRRFFRAGASVPE